MKFLGSRGRTRSALDRDPTMVLAILTMAGAVVPGFVRVAMAPLKPAFTAPELQRVKTQSENCML